MGCNVHRKKNCEVKVAMNYFSTEITVYFMGNKIIYENGSSLSMYYIAYTKQLLEQDATVAKTQGVLGNSICIEISLISFHLGTIVYTWLTQDI